MDALVTCLASSLSSEPAVRQQAETSLEQRAYPINDPQGAYGIELARVFADNTVSLPLRQAAGIALKKYVYERWSIYFDEYLRQATTANAVGDAGAVPEDAKHTVHLLLLEALGDAERKIRLLAAQLLSIVGSCDFPDHFPELLPVLRDYLLAYHASDARAADRVNGAMKFLSDFVQVELDENQLLEIAQQFIPPLQQILADDSVSVSAHTKARCVLVFRQCLTSLHTVRETYAQTVDEAVARYLPPWLDALHTLLDASFYAQADWREARTWEVLGLRREIVRTLGVASRFRKQFAPAASTLMVTCIANLEQLAPLFAQVELAADPVYDEPSTPDGDADVACGVPGVATALFNLFAETLETRALRALLVEGGTGGEGAATGAFAHLVRLLTVYAQITHEDEELFEDDPSAFVDEDDEESMLVTLRTSATDFLDQLLDTYPLPLLRVLGGVARAVEHTPSTGDVPNADGVIPWKWREALLMLLGNTHNLLEEVLDTASGDDHMLRPLDVVQTIAVPSMARGTPSFLRGRSFVFVSQYISLLDEGFRHSVFAEAMQVLHAPDAEAPLHVKLSAVRAVRNLAQLSDALPVDDARAIVRELGPLLLHAHGSPLVLVIDAVDAALDAPFTDADASLLVDVGRAALQTWRAHAADPQVEISLAALLESLVRRAGPGAAEVVRLGVEAAAQALYDDPQGTGLGASAAAMARALLAAAPAPLLEGSVAPLLAAAAHYLVHVDDVEAAQSLVFCLTLLFQKRPEDVLAWDDHGMPALEVVLRIVQRQLQSEDEAAIGMPFGVLLVTLFLQASASASTASALVGVMPGLVHALAAKLVVASSSDCIMATLFPLQFLFAQHTDEVVRLLSATSVGEGDALRAVVAKWLEHAELAIGHAVTNLHLLALARFYTQWPASLDTLTVKGDVRAVPADGTWEYADAVIVTRSKARSAELYDAIPARVKVAQLLVHDFQAQADERSHAADLAAAVDMGAVAEDADGWEDDEEANAADAERDARRLAFLDDLGALGVDLDDDGDEDPPYMAPIVALPGFAPIASLDRVATLAEALRHTPTDVAARLTPEQRTAWQAAQDYTPT